MSKHPVDLVAEFMKLGGQHFPDDTDYSITAEEIEPFLGRTEEEVQETISATYADYSPKIAEVLDGFVDTAYVALTGAIRLVGPEKAKAAWDAVVDANLAKVDGRYGPAIIDPDTGKIGKPKGWTAPDIEAIVVSEELK